MEGKQHPRWTRLSEEFLVENIRSHKCLWDHTDNSYLKKTLKRAAYNTITCALRDSFPELTNITAEQVRSKYNNLRAYFMKVYRKVQATPSGSAGHYTSKWELFDVLSFLKDTLNNYTTKASDSFTAEASAAVDTFSIVIHEDGIQEASIASPSSSSTPSPLYSYTSSPSPCTTSLPSPLCEGNTAEVEAPSPVAGSALLSTGMTPVHSSGTTSSSKRKRRHDISHIEEECREALQNLNEANKEKDDFSFSFGRMVTHWMRDLPSAERMSAAFQLLGVMKNYNSRQNI
ncbi:uncharacterized protein LOC123502378 [Portunus trituberculatus]|uniref:uncharacterized protein LOC123502378 n=1 Tax=Portunus trituberculatus TaxID=210409 RepID=UPI001E1D1AFC|nr:uncharacterized protein LOC123502378 [Portunus trituberculatus]